MEVAPYVHAFIAGRPDRHGERERVYIYVYACMQSDTSILREGFVNQLVTGVVSGNPLDALAICV